jgi:hypothetical protein
MADGRRSEKSIFLDALGRAADERAPFLDRACDGDPDLRAAVEALLRAHAGLRRLLDTQVAGPADGRTVAAEGPGTAFGPYQLTRAGEWNGVRQISPRGRPRRVTTLHAAPGGRELLARIVLIGCHASQPRQP